jgi:hypothetical protein
MSTYWIVGIVLISVLLILFGLVAWAVHDGEGEKLWFDEN